MPKSFVGLSDREAPALRSAGLKTHAHLPLPNHRAPEITKSEPIHKQTHAQIAQVLDEEQSEREAA